MKKIIYAVVFLLSLNAYATSHPVAHNKAEMLMETPTWEPMAMSEIFGAEITVNGQNELLNVIAAVDDVQSSSGILGRCQIFGGELFKRRIGRDLQYAAVATLKDTASGNSREFVLRSFRSYGGSFPGPFGTKRVTYYVSSDDEIGGKFFVAYHEVTNEVLEISAPGFSCVK